MKNLFYIWFIIVLTSQVCYGQTYKYSSGNIEILAIAPLDTVTATSSKMIAILDMKSKSVSFNCFVESFVFEDQLILTNLSRTILNVKEYPLITFEGKIQKNKKEKLSKDKQEFVIIDGTLTLNGIFQNHSVEAKLISEKDAIRVTFVSMVDLNDYKVVIPSLLRDALSNNIQITFDVSLTLSSKKSNG